MGALVKLVQKVHAVLSVQKVKLVSPVFRVCPVLWASQETAESKVFVVRQVNQVLHCEVHLVFLVREVLWDKKGRKVFEVRSDTARQLIVVNNSHKVNIPSKEMVVSKFGRKKLININNKRRSITD